MKRIAAMGLALALLLGGAPNARAVGTHAQAPFMFTQAPSAMAGGLVECSGWEDGLGSVTHVYTMDGMKIALSEPTAQEVLMLGGYLCAQLQDGGLWTVFRADGTRALAGAYDRVDVYGDLAFGWMGNWRPPGDFYGTAEVFNLKTGQKLLPGKYNHVNVSGAHLRTSYYLDGGTDTLQDVVQMWDFAGNDVTAALGYTVEGAAGDGFYEVRDCATGKYGVINTQGTVCVPMQYDAIGDANGQGAVAVRRDGDWPVWGAVRLADGSQVVPLSYAAVDMLPGGVIAGKKDGWTRESDGNPVFLYDSLGRRIPSDGMDACHGLYGGVIYVRRAADDALLGINAAGETLVEPVEGGYLSFCAEGYDVVLIGRNGYAEGGMIVGKDGVILAPFDTAGFVDAWETGVKLQDYQTGAMHSLWSDGTVLDAAPDAGEQVDIGHGWIVYSNTDAQTAWLADLAGNILIPAGVFTELSSDGSAPYHSNAGGGRPPRPALVARDRNGKYGALTLEADGQNADVQAAARLALPAAMHFALPRPLGDCAGALLARRS